MEVDIQDPPCVAPYTVHRHQCLYFPSTNDSITAARLFCYQAGGVLPYNFQGYHGLELQISEDALFWLNYNPESQRCFACRPGTFCRGVTPVPCESRLRSVVTVSDLVRSGQVRSGPGTLDNR